MSFAPTATAAAAAVAVSKPGVASALLSVCAEYTVDYTVIWFPWSQPKTTRPL